MVQTYQAKSVNGSAVETQSTGLAEETDFSKQNERRGSVLLDPGWAREALSAAAALGAAAGHSGAAPAVRDAGTQAPAWQEADRIGTQRRAALRDDKRGSAANEIAHETSFSITALQPPAIPLPWECHKPLPKRKAVNNNDAQRRKTNKQTLSLSL